MGSLARLQRDFLEAILGEGAEGLEGSLRERGAPAAERLAVHRRTSAANLREALAAAYPVVERLVGGAFFTEAATRYARAFPSTSGDLHRFGGDFPAFLAGYPHARQVACLPDVARLEWAWHECFHAADGARIDFAALAAVPPRRHGALRFRLHPAVRLVDSAHPVLAIWEANQPGRDGVPERVEGPERVLVHREDFAVRMRALEPFEWNLLGAVGRGATLDEALGAGAADGGEGQLGETLRRLAAESVLAGFVLD